MKFVKKRAGFSIKLSNWPWFKPTYFRCGNFGQFYGFGLCITFPLSYHLDFVFNEGYDAGFRDAYGGTSCAKEPPQYTVEAAKTAANTARDASSKQPAPVA